MQIVVQMCVLTIIWILTNKMSLMDQFMINVVPSFLPSYLSTLALRFYTVCDWDVGVEGHIDLLSQLCRNIRVHIRTQMQTAST